MGEYTKHSKFFISLLEISNHNPEPIWLCMDAFDLYKLNNWNIPIKFHSAIYKKGFVRY